MTVAGDSTGDDRGRGQDGREGHLSWLAGRRVEISPRYSRFVGLMKLCLPALAWALIVAVVAWPGAFGQRDGFHISFSRLAGDGGRNLTMVHPRYVGIDAENRPFTVTADSATQNPRDQRLVSLASPEAQITLENGARLSLTAAAGLYNQGQQTLDLTGPIGIASSQGYEFHARSLHVDFGAGTARSEEPVDGRGPIGTLRADRLTISERGQRLHFEGDVKLVLRPKQAG